MMLKTFRPREFLQKMSPGRFGPRPFFAIRAYLNFVFWARKVAETFSIQQNVRNGHIYIGLMKQHMA